LLALSLLNVQVLLIPATGTDHGPSAAPVRAVIADASCLPRLKPIVGPSTPIVVTGRDAFPANLTSAGKTSTLAQVADAGKGDFKKHSSELDDIFLKYVVHVDGEVRAYSFFRSSPDTDLAA
jgi:hypothetical protein